MANCNDITGRQSIDLSAMDGEHGLEVKIPVSELELCVPTPECYAVVWYVFGNTVVGLDNNYYGLKDFSCCKDK